MMKSRTISVVFLAAASLCAVAALSGCTGPPTASQIKIGEDFAELPKAGQYNAKYEYTNALTGEHRLLEIKDATVDPSAALRAYAETQAANLNLLNSLANRIAIPGVVAPAAIAGPPATVTPGPAPPVVPK